ncbi:glycerol acyltransferase [Pelobium manganitolerans]|uniref:Glycerol acyltransferase n=1 Tax=Pelobium manganitolerans TaxID=1842495 RepID=A0A419SBR8_9SPHI|nr:lysophospholipid acyltransferase family protein [Pelobium manganitolerans]RKD20113.1 glycerol acyltransferase [Pelobium manganitolerans]
MIKPKSNKIIYAFFAWYIKRIIGKDFSGFHFQAIDYPKEKAILLLANHFSWWDGFILFQLNRLYFKKKFHVMVLEETSKKVRFLKYLGAFSIQKNAKSLLESLDYAGSLLNQPDNLLLIFPQGQLQSQHSKSISFQKGLFKIINASQKNFSYIFAVTLVDYFQHRKPKIHIFLQHWQAPPFASLQMIKTAYNKHYEEVLQQQSEIKV